MYIHTQRQPGNNTNDELSIQGGDVVLLIEHPCLHVCSVDDQNLMPPATVYIVLITTTPTLLYEGE